MNTQQSVQSPIEGALSKILELFMLLFMFSKMRQFTKGETFKFLCIGVKNMRCLEGWGK